MTANTKYSAVRILYINPKFYIVNEVLILNPILFTVDFF
jgi:hypothetical protein